MDISVITEVDKLQLLIESGIWRNNSDLAEKIFVRLTELTKDYSNYGTGDFWDAIFPPEETVQVGGGNLESDREANGKTHGKIDSCQYVISKEFNQRLKKLRHDARAFIVEFKDLEQCDNPSDVVRRCVIELLAKAFEGVKPGTTVGLRFDHPGLTKGPLILPMLTADQYDVDNVMRAIELVLQSAEDFELDNRFRAQFTIDETK